MSQEGHGDHWACVFESFEAVAGKWLPLFLEQGRILDSKETGRLKEGQTVGILFGESPLAVLSLVSGVLRDSTLSNVFASAYPFAN